MIFHIVNTHGQPTTFFFCSSWTQQLSTTFPARLLFCYVSIVFYNICLRKYFRFLYPIHLVFKHKPGIFKQKPFPCFWLTTTNCLVRLGTNLLLTVLLIQLMSLSFLSLFFCCHSIIHYCIFSLFHFLHTKAKHEYCMSIFKTFPIISWHIQLL